MKELIPIRPEFINDHQVNTINARELHAFMEIGKDFSNWIKKRISQYGFVEDKDYVITSETEEDSNLDSPDWGNQDDPDGENANFASPNREAKFDSEGQNGESCSPKRASKIWGGHNKTEYNLTLDMAKELSMVERNAKGKQARQYFIDCEKKLLKGPSGRKQALEDMEVKRHVNASKLFCAMQRVYVASGVTKHRAAAKAAEVTRNVAGLDFTPPDPDANSIAPKRLLKNLLEIKTSDLTVNHLLLNSINPMTHAMTEAQNMAFQVLGFRITKRGLFIRTHLSIHLWPEKYPDLTAEDAINILLRLPGSSIARQRLDGVTMRGVEIPTSVIISNTTEEAAA